MTHAEALSTGQAAANRFGKPFSVYRLSAWPEGVYALQATNIGLPREAVTDRILESEHRDGRANPKRNKLEQGGLFE